MSHHRLAGCRSCVVFNECGGTDGQQNIFGCFESCIAKGTCTDQDWTCPCRMDQFSRRMSEVGGLSPPPHRALRHQEIRLGAYLPTILHGSRRQVRLDIPVAAIRLPRLFVGTRGEYRLKYSSGSELRSHLRLGQETKIVLRCVCDDQPLEDFWAWHVASNAIEQLKHLDIAAITVPNFSFFSDAPRFHTIWNRRRTIALAEKFSDAGFTVVPHLNALTAGDWRFWADYLREMSKISIVAKEFQTGNMGPAKALQALDHLAELEQRLGRSLHIVAIGANQHTRLIASRFKHFTVSDSKAFMSAMNRQRLRIRKGRLRERSFPTAQGACLSSLLHENIETQSRWIRRNAREARRAAPSIQLSFHLGAVAKRFAQ